MKREITIDDLPAPGEPLEEMIAPENQVIIDEEIQERAARIQAKLPRRELRKLQHRHIQLGNQLNHHRYNELITRRWELYQLCVRLTHELKTRRHSKKQVAAMRLQIRTSAQHGKKLSEKLRSSQHLIDEFLIVAQRLKAHNDVLEWERKEAEDFKNFQREAHVWLEQIKSVCKQSARLHYRGKDSKGNEFTHIPEVERIIIKDDKVLYQIRTSAQGLLERFFGRWHSALPYDVDIPDLICEDTLLNLSAGCKRTVQVERSSNGVNLFWCISRMDSPDGIPRKILYSKVIDWYPIEDHRKTPWAAGVTTDRKVEWMNFEDHPHVLVAGASGGGKSTHLNGMIATIASMNRPDECRMVMIDLKGGVEFSHWRGLKHLMGNIVKTHGGVLEALRLVREIMENRLATFESVRAKNLLSYNAKAAQPIPRIILFIDELATLIGLGELTTDIHTELRVLTSQGRAAGIHLVLATQHPSVDVLPGWIKTNMGIRIASKMPTQIASQIILDTGTAALIPSIAGRMVFSIGRDEFIAQSPFISDQEIAQAVRLSQAFPDVEAIPEPEPIEVREKFTAQDAIEIALVKLEGSLSAKRIHEIVGNEVITRRKLATLIGEIIEARGIDYKGVWYRVRKFGKAHLLESIPRYHNDKEDSDTEEFHGIERGIEDEEALSA